ncbi:cellulose synthase [Streptomonospora sp. PA3]|uniref:cellulose synthase n=1 Tax=Streptomonospora sp. PA3 TaxID=2607326 RepID=UPI0012DC4A67|nr:cellulose synthase [Streptomonospora sp. PA3]MUL43391.1 cellulose synthase [Streptomonospora sp. PA3]
MPEQLPIAGPMLGAALTVVGLLVSWVVWRRRGAASGLRGVAWSLLPLAAGLLGLMTILWRLVTDLVGFFVSLAFNPVVWGGVVVAALAVVLWVVSGVMRARGVGVRKGGERASAEEGRRPAAGIDSASGGAAGAAGAQGQSRRGAKQQAGGDDDFGEIEDLLRKHGIE